MVAMQYPRTSNPVAGMSCTSTPASGSVLLSVSLCNGTFLSKYLLVSPLVPPLKPTKLPEQHILGPKPKSRLSPRTKGQCCTGWSLCSHQAQVTTDSCFAEVAPSCNRRASTL